jgi:hypothetical protein
VVFRILPLEFRAKARTEGPSGKRALPVKLTLIPMNQNGISASPPDTGRYQVSVRRPEASTIHNTPRIVTRAR